MGGVTFQILLAASAIKIAHRTVNTFGSGNSGAVSLGTATSDRLIVVVVVGGQHPTSLSISGVGFTQIGSVAKVGIWSAQMGTSFGTSGTISLGGTAGGQAWMVYSVYNAKPSAFAVVGNGVLNIPKNGVCIGGACSLNPGTPIGWTGLTVDVEQALFGVTRISTASKEFTAAQTPLSNGASGGAPDQVEASWGP